MVGPTAMATDTVGTIVEMRWPSDIAALAHSTARCGGEGREHEKWVSDCEAGLHRGCRRNRHCAQRSSETTKNAAAEVKTMQSRALTDDEEEVDEALELVGEADHPVRDLMCDAREDSKGMSQRPRSRQGLLESQGQCGDGTDVGATHNKTHAGAKRNESMPGRREEQAGAP
jgi:hypothetical protein